MDKAAEILVEVSARVALVTLNRPQVKNAFTDGMRDTLLDVLETLACDADVRCIVITGAGDAFCAGGDIASMVALQERNDTTVLERRMAVASQVVQAMRAIPQPIIGAINGAAAGGGANLALGCDMRLGSETALFSQSFVKIGLVPDWAGFYLLPQLVGTAKAMELMLSGARIDAEQALRLGLLNHVFAGHDFLAQVLEFAAQLAAGPAQAMATIKRGVYVGASGNLEQALAYEYRAQKNLFLEPDAREGMRAFLEKRAPKFS